MERESSRDWVSEFLKRRAARGGVAIEEVVEGGLEWEVRRGGRGFLSCAWALILGDCMRRDSRACCSKLIMARTVWFGEKQKAVGVRRLPELGPIEHYHWM